MSSEPERSGRTMRVYIHSDDAGATEGVSQGVLEAWRDGTLDGFSIFANGTGLECVRSALASEFDRPARLAAHLNLTQGASLAPAREVDLLVDAEGRFDRRFLALAARRWRLDGPSYLHFLQQVELEWRTQIRRVREIAGSHGLAFVDGHNHVHMIPSLFEIAARLAAEEGVAGIRIAAEPLFLSGSGAGVLRPDFWVGGLRHVLLNRLARRARRVAVGRGLASTRYVIGLWSSCRLSAEIAQRGIAAARRRGADAVEVLFHVGRARAEEGRGWEIIPAFRDFYLSADRDRERHEARRLRRMLAGCCTPAPSPDEHGIPISRDEMQASGRGDRGFRAPPEHGPRS